MAMHLREAGQSQRISILLQILSYVLLAVGLFGLATWASCVFSLAPGLVASGFFLTFPIITLLLWLFASNRSKVALRTRDQALEQAYLLAILSTLRAGSIERDTEGIAQLIGLSVERTENLLTKLNADERMTSRVTDAGELLFGLAEPAHMRVADTDATASVSSSTSQEIIDAEFEETGGTDSHLRHQT